MMPPPHTKGATFYFTYPMKFFMKQYTAKRVLSLFKSTSVFIRGKAKSSETCSASWLPSNEDWGVFGVANSILKSAFIDILSYNSVNVNVHIRIENLTQFFHLRHPSDVIVCSSDNRISSKTFLKSPAHFDTSIPRGLYLTVRESSIDI